MSMTKLNPKESVVSKTADGLCPQLPNETTTTKYLRQDGSWSVPPDNNDTYPKAVKNITRSGTTFTATCYDNSTFTFTQQDNNTTYSCSTTYGTTMSNNQIRLGRVVLYNNDTGTNGTVSLSASAANYNHMRIYYRTNDGERCVGADIYSPNGKSVIISGGRSESNGINFKQKKISISGTSITSGWSYEAYFNGGGSVSFNCLYILRVEGWNE